MIDIALLNISHITQKSRKALYYVQLQEQEAFRLVEWQALLKGAAWAIQKGFGDQADLDYLEDRGTIAGADPDKVSERALERGRAQLGALGSVLFRNLTR